MNKYLKLFPISWIFLPFLYFIIGNFHDLSLFESLIVILFPIVLSFTAILIVKLTELILSKKYQKHIFPLVCLGIFMTFNYSLFGLSPILFLLTSLIVFIFIPFLIHKSNELNKIIAITSVSMALICIFQISILGFQLNFSSSGNVENDFTIKSLDDDQMDTLPNVYSIFLDAYSRSDQLSILGFDNSFLENNLKKQGFYIAQKSKSNFVKTDLSMYTFWNMDYPKITNNMPDINKLLIQSTVLGNSKSISIFKELGYQYVRMGPNQSRLQDCSGYEDLCLFQINSVDGTAGGMSSNIITQIFRMTPFYLVWYKYFSAAKRNLSLKSTLRDAKNSLRSKASMLTAPYFVSIHVWQPHAPYLFQRDCTPHTVQIPYTKSWDRNGLNKDQNIDYYIQATECTNIQLLELTREIISSDPNAIIMVQSDHGHAFSMDLELDPVKWTEEAKIARSSIFWAVKAPEQCKKHLYPDISSVNSLRFIFGCIVNDDPMFLDDITFIHNNTEYLRLQLEND
tara:strand:+ start:1853 stop:3385 length:1533 start_codon:yes stop_codon:yes gene_type:complete